MRVAVAALVAAAMCVVALLTGCGGQDKVIGRGPTALIFENDGSKDINVEVRWTDDGGVRRSREFDLRVNGRVEVRAPDRSEYKVLLKAEPDTLTSAEPEPVTLRDPQ